LFKRHFGWGLILILAVAASLQAQYRVLHTFMGPPTDGEQPWGSLILKGATLYGMSQYGGASNSGAIFRISVEGTGFTLLHSFVGGASDGKNPYGSLKLYNGKLYGMTYAGGANDTGVIFRMNLDGTGFKLLHTFAGGATDGALPFGSLIFYSGMFYGMTYRGGASSAGTIFKMSPGGTGFKLLHTFAAGATDGADPRGSLILVGTKLYGMTSVGGASNLGTIFRISPSGAGFGLLHSFSGAPSDGSYPWTGSLVASGSMLYGMTMSGGTADWGAIFKISTSGAGFALLHSFSLETTDGTSPVGSLILGGAKLYGMTQVGGANYYGTIFGINLNGTGFELLHSFDFDAGAYPYGDLVGMVSTKYGTMLYGMTNYNNGSNDGVIFSYKLK